MQRIIAAALAAAFILPTGALGDTIVSSKSRSKQFAAQTRFLDNRASVQYRASVGIAPPSIVAPSKYSEGPSYSGRYQGQFVEVARGAARKYNVPEDLFLRLVQQESGWNSNALSHKGAIGLAQLMPGTAARLRVDPHDPQQNLEGGARYLRMMYDRYRDWRLALAAYNAGPGAVDKHGGIPPYTETKVYVVKIMGS
ncbi:lytic transglycosylase domain-containing protein [Roseicyclus sp. F158]|uniref:Lytic transglycosylase domain-containing protein n=1 Tax=Tropicimonas omnivorans TaxID=3075590 RepID=A0ABU3DJP9_9RHOB|nr:lytic transglycosylase domain-containing protein [Roseicyclus sp. F158]MDT0683945.1 lytic transglycosylase domain-containing protein [Roseicyclus sp. F158]